MTVKELRDALDKLWPDSVVRLDIPQDWENSPVVKEVYECRGKNLVFLRGVYECPRSSVKLFPSS